MTTPAPTPIIKVYNIKVNDNKLEQTNLEIPYKNDLNTCKFFITCENATKLRNILEKYISEPAEQDKKQYDLATNIDGEINKYIDELNKLKSTTNIYQSLKSRLGLQLKVKEKFLQTHEYLLKKNKEAYKINYLKFIKLKLEIRLTKLKISEFKKKVKQEEPENEYKIEVLYKQINKQKKNTRQNSTQQVSAVQQPESYEFKTGIIKEINVNAKTFKFDKTPENKNWTNKFARNKEGKFIELCVINNNTLINNTPIIITNNNIDNKCELTQIEKKPDPNRQQRHRSHTTP